MNGFVSHAEIHQLAYKTDWTSLRALSTYRLIQSLKIFTLFEECTKDIVRLARFVFKESEYIVVICKRCCGDHDAKYRFQKFSGKFVFGKGYFSFDVEREHTLGVKYLRHLSNLFVSIGFWKS